MSKNNNLTDHEAYDSFFATEKQKEEFENDKNFSRGFKAFFICVGLALLCGFFEVSIFGSMGGLANLCIAAGAVSFLYATKMFPCGYFTSIGSVIVAALSVIYMIEKAKTGVRSVSDLDLPFAVADLAMILSATNLLFLLPAAVSSRQPIKKTRKRKRTKTGETDRIPVSLVVIALIGSLGSLAAFVIGFVLSFSTFL